MDASPVVADAQPAGSSPAADQTPGDPLDSLNETDLHTWRMTGTLPDPVAETSTAESSSATAVQDPPASTDAPPEAASEPADYKAKTKARMDELLAERARADERADRAERRAAELEARSRQPQPDARPAAPSAAPAGSLPKPVFEDFLAKTDDYSVAVGQFTEALTDWKAQMVRQALETEQQQQRQRAEQAQVLKRFEANVETARAKYPDFDDKALKADSAIPQGSLVDAFIWENPAGVDVLYHLQTHPAEVRRLLALPVLEQIADLVRLADRLTATPAAGSSTQIPPPPPTLGTRGTPTDPVERALAADDFGAYKNAMNHRDLARLKR